MLCKWSISCTSTGLRRKAAVIDSTASWGVNHSFVWSIKVIRFLSKERSVLSGMFPHVSRWSVLMSSWRSSYCGMMINQWQQCHYTYLIYNNYTYLYMTVTWGGFFEVRWPFHCNARQQLWGGGNLLLEKGYILLIPVKHDESFHTSFYDVLNDVK